MVQANKIQCVEETAERFSRAQSVVFVGYQGLKVRDMRALRVNLRKSGGELKVVKNRLTRRALVEAKCDAVDDVLVGTVALAFGYDDPTVPAKVCAEFAKTNAKLSIKAGLLERKRISADKVKALAALPSRTELLGQMAATLMAPARQMATALNQAMAKVVYAMKARADQMGAS